MTAVIVNSNHLCFLAPQILYSVIDRRNSFHITTNEAVSHSDLQIANLHYLSLPVKLVLYELLFPVAAHMSYPAPERLQVMGLVAITL